MIIATGVTFPHRDTLRELGGSWNNIDKRWEFNRLSFTNQERLRALVGIMIADVDEPTPEPEPFPILSDEDIDALIIKYTGGERQTGIGPSAIYGDDPTYYNYFADQNPSAFFGFSSLGRFVDYIDSLPASFATDERRSGWETGGAKWNGTNSMGQALDLARNGWLDGLEQAEAIRERLTLANPRVRRRKAAVAGGTVSVGRMLAGEPAHMIRRPPQPGRKVITIFVECGFDGNIDGDTAINRAAIIAAIIDIMEDAGYSCTIVAVDTSLWRLKPIYQVAVTLKEAGERLNLADVVFALGHPAFLRRLSFAAQSSVPETEPSWIGLGRSSNSFDDDHRCKSNEFYVPVITVNEDDPFDLLPYVIPANLPVKIERD